MLNVKLSEHWLASRKGLLTGIEGAAQWAPFRSFPFVKSAKKLILGVFESRQ